MGRILYKDIELDEANKEVHFAHSRFVGRDINTDWMDSLRSIDKNSLSHAQFGDISRLNSVANLDYQVCNGGVAQYFDNGYDCYREPYNEQDVAHFGKSEQVSQLQALARFGESVFPEKALENSNIRHIADALTPSMIPMKPNLHGRSRRALTMTATITASRSSLRSSTSASMHPAVTSNPSWNSTRSTSANPSTQSGSAVVPPMRRVAATLPSKPAT